MMQYMKILGIFGLKDLEGKGSREEGEGTSIILIWIELWRGEKGGGLRGKSTIMPC